MGPTISGPISEVGLLLKTSLMQPQSKVALSRLLTNEHLAVTEICNQHKITMTTITVKVGIYFQHFLSHND